MKKLKTRFLLKTKKPFLTSMIEGGHDKGLH